MELKWNPNGTQMEQTKQNEKVSHVCIFCNNIFSGANSLARHTKSCYNKQQQQLELKEKIKELSSQLETYKLNEKHYLKENEHYKAETNHYKQLLREAGGIVKKSVNSLSYAMDHYNTAPALKTIKMEDVDAFNVRVV